MKDKISFSQSVLTMVLFCFGSSVVMGINTKAGQDGWIAILLASAAIVPVFLLYARIIRLFPGQDFFKILEHVFGKAAGKLVSVFFVWYAIHLGALVLRNFTEFTQITAMPETPQLPIMILMILTTAYLAGSGMRSLGKWSMVMVFFVVFVVLFTFFASVPHLKPEILMPILSHSPAEVAQSSFQIFSFPFAECVIFLCLAGSFYEKSNPRKIFLYALLFSFIIFLLVFLRNLSLLGLSMMQLNIFPSYVTVRIIEVGNFFSRIEGSISSNLLFAGIVKMAVCQMAAARGVAQIFNLREYRLVLLPVSLLVMSLCAILYRNAMEMLVFFDYYPYYAFPFQVLIPLAVWITGEFQNRKQKKQEASA